MPASAGESRSTVAVSATVQPVVRVQQSSSPNHRLVISSMDIQRGYVEVPSAVRMQVSSNSAQGYALDVLPVSNVFSSVVIRGLEGDVVLGADGGAVVQRWQHGQTVSLNLNFQFALRPDVQPGEYSWPVHLSVRPL
ncbi:MAG TPA: hypothetical protein VHL14_03725 [Steroidobacteraceae bacterium]|nr:hypothetical protein [Steroidobacteraceae bacterium]